MSDFVRDCLKIDLLRYQKIMLDLYGKDDLKRNDILQKRSDGPMEKQNLNGLKSEIIIDEFAFKDKE